jgi:hypothetical protein
MARTVFAEGNAMGRGPVLLEIPWSTIHHVLRLSREEEVPEFRELDLRIIRTTVHFILEAMKGSTQSSLSQHIQQMILHCLEIFHILNLDAPQLGLSALPFHLPGCVRQLNQVRKKMEP